MGTGTLYKWALDFVEFSDFGVHVKSSSGVLDIPKIVDTSINWLDENGREYWQDPEDLKREDKDIVLSCWLLADDYADLKAKVQAFYSALSGEGKRTLSTPFGVDIDCYLKDQIQFTRYGSYVKAIQLGFFNLKLTVPGDSLSKLITVYAGDGSVRAVVNYRSDGKLNRVLMGDSSITFNLEFNTHQTLGRGDYVIWNGAKYYALEYPEQDKYSSNKYVYKEVFQHEFFLLKDVQFRINGYAESYYWGTMDDIVDRIIENTNRAYPGLFVKGYIETTVNKNHQFTNESCYDILTKIAGDYELEWDYQTASGQIVIDVKQQIGNSTDVSVSYGKGNGVYKINRVSTGRDLLVTRLYAYGSTRNIPSTYGCNRLQLATQPLVKDFYGMHVEKTKVFDDIFPERTGIVTSYTFTPSPDPENYPEKAKYEFVDSSMPFDLKEKDNNGNTVYWISGTNPKIHYNSGDMAGFEFEVKDYDHSTKTFSLTKIKEANDIEYPNADLYPKPGDEYVLLDINLPQSYIDDAESRLLVKAQAYIDEYFNPKATYTLETTPNFDVTALKPGDYIQFTDTDFGINGALRIRDMALNIYSNAATITLSDVVKVNRLKSIEIKATTAFDVLQAQGMTEANQQRGNEVSTREVKRFIIDPIDEKFKADDLVRDESIDQRMLAYEAVAPGWHCDAVVELNYNDNEDLIKVSSGNFVVHSWREYTMTRAEIAKLTEAYDPSRTWSVPETIITLPTKAAYFLFAELDTTAESTTCTIVAYEQFKRVKEGFNDPGGILRFLITPITGGEEMV